MSLLSIGFLGDNRIGQVLRPAGRGRYQRAGRASGYRNGHRERRLLGTFGPVTLSVPRARLFDAAGGDREWKSQTLPAFKRRTKRAEAVIAGSYSYPSADYFRFRRPSCGHS